MDGHMDGQMDGHGDLNLLCLWEYKKSLSLDPRLASKGIIIELVC